MGIKFLFRPVREGISTIPVVRRQDLVDYSCKTVYPYHTGTDRYGMDIKSALPGTIQYVE